MRLAPSAPGPPSWGQSQRSSWNIWLDSGIVWWLVGWPIDKELRSCLTCKLCHLSPAGMPAVQKRSGREIVFARRTSIKTSIKAASSSPTIERWRSDRQQALVAITFHLKMGWLHCVTRAPLLYFIRSWVALSFKVVSQSGIGNTCPDLQFLQYIKAWMSSTDPVSSITNCYRLIVSYTDPVHSFIIS